jgi:hypothetical protein
MASSACPLHWSLIHLSVLSQSQVVHTDGPETVSKTTKQASSWVPLLLPTLTCDRTFQNMIGLHFWVFPALFPCYLGVSSPVSLLVGLLAGLFSHLRFWPQEGSVTLRGERGTERDQKKTSIFFHYTCPSKVNSLHNHTCSARAVVHHITVEQPSVGQTCRFLRFSF